jgi:DnaJ-class molecular chaperone
MTDPKKGERMTTKKDKGEFVPVRWRTCDECDGSGRKPPMAWVQGFRDWYVCEECDGKGKKPVFWDEDDE